VDLQQYTHHEYPNASDQAWQTVSSNRSRQPQSQQQQQQQQQQKQQQQKQKQKHRSTRPLMLLLVGIPGSGKSTFATTLESVAPHLYVRINQDTLGSRRRCEDLTRQVLAQHKCPIIDRCNFNVSQRRHFLDIALEYNIPVNVVALEIPKETCIQRCQQRSSHETIRRGEEQSVVEKLY